jgi:hypothetical protein
LGETNEEALQAECDIDVFTEQLLHTGLLQTSLPQHDGVDADQLPPVEAEGLKLHDPFWTTLGLLQTSLPQHDGVNTEQQEAEELKLHDPFRINLVLKVLRSHIAAATRSTSCSTRGGLLMFADSPAARLRMIPAFKKRINFVSVITPTCLREEITITDQLRAQQGEDF